MRSVGIVSGALGILVWVSIGCGGGSTSQGGARQSCYPNGTCNAGLNCFSNVCVDVDAGSAGSTGGSHDGGGSAGTGGAGGAAAGGGSSGTGGSAGAAAGGGSGGVGGSAGAGQAGFSGSGGASGAGGIAGATGLAGAGGSTGVAGSMGTGGSNGGAAGGAGAGCSSGGAQNGNIPTVLILVDRSGVEFDSATTGTFFTLRTAVEQVVMQLQGQVRFGLASFVGDHSSGSCELNYESVPIALNNYAAIQTAYDSWGPLLPYGTKADTPAVEAIPMVKATLQADAGNGQKYMLFVTDSETDFCDDGNTLCPADAVTYQIQDMYAATPSIGTLVIGLPTSLDSLAPTVLQNFANAGTGQAVVVPMGAGAAIPSDVYYQCNGLTDGGSYSWSNLYTAAGHGALQPTSIATYSATGGTATVYAPDTTSETDLENQILMAICRPSTNGSP
jgi:hypothetical protein